jgi:hypothetical protein
VIAPEPILCFVYGVITRVARRDVPTLHQIGQFQDSVDRSVTPSEEMASSSIQNFRKVAVRGALLGPQSLNSMLNRTFCGKTDEMPRAYPSFSLSQYFGVCKVPDGRLPVLFRRRHLRNLVVVLTLSTPFDVRCPGEERRIIIYYLRRPSAQF